MKTWAWHHSQGKESMIIKSQRTAKEHLCSNFAGGLHDIIIFGYKFKK